MAAKKPKSPAKSKQDLENAKQASFLAAYARSGANIVRAAKASKIHRDSHYEWMKSDPTYPDRFEVAHKEGIDYLEACVTQSAMEGWEEPVVYQGQLTYEPKRNKDGSFKKNEEGDILYSDKPLTIRKRNDVAAFFLLKAHRPDKYRENSTVELTGSIEIVDRLTAARARLRKQRDENKS
jgi:hypothetical protein